MGQCLLEHLRGQREVDTAATQRPVRLWRGVTLPRARADGADAGVGSTVVTGPAQTAVTCRLLYVPQVGHATCGSLGSRQRSQVTIVGRLAFQFARRERVLERDVFRFGTATAMPF